MDITANKLNAICQLKNPYRVLKRIDKHYCARVKSVGLCDTNCPVTCRDRLQKVFRPMRGVNNKYAILVWRLREEAERFTESSQTEATLKTNWLGEVEEEDPFEAFEATLE